MTEREKILARIRALAAKTVENGCTEGEALAAAEKLAKLLAAHNLTLDEAEIRAQPYSEASERSQGYARRRLTTPAGATADLCDCAWWTSKPGVWPIEITFFGADHDVEVARYLLAICDRALDGLAARMDGELWRFTKARRQLRIWPALDGMADRLAERIRALKPPAPVGTGLMVLKRELVDAALRDRGVELEDGWGIRSRERDAGYAEGRKAADQVALNRGLQAYSTAARLGGRGR